MAHHNDDPSKFSPLARAFLWTDDPKKVKRLVNTIYVLCAVLFFADFFYAKHPYFAMERVPGFYALYGFIMCAALVVCAKVMRLILMRPENYYAPHDVESEDYPEDQLERINHDD